MISKETPSSIQKKIMSVFGEFDEDIVDKAVHAERERKSTFDDDKEDDDQHVMMKNENVSKKNNSSENIGKLQISSRR